MPWDWLPVGLALFENPISGFRQVASGGTHSQCLSLGGALEEAHDVQASPVGVAALPDDHIGSLDEGLLQVVVGLPDHAAVVDLAAAGAYAGDETGIAGQVLGGREALDGSQLPVDHDGEDLRRTGERHEQLDRAGELDSLEDALFQALDVGLKQVEQLQFLLHAAAGRCWRSCWSWRRHLGVKISLAVSSERAYLARVEWMRFLSMVRTLEKAMRVR